MVTRTITRLEPPCASCAAPARHLWTVSRWYDYSASCDECMAKFIDGSPSIISIITLTPPLGPLLAHMQERHNAQCNAVGEDSFHNFRQEILGESANLYCAISGGVTIR